MRDLDMAVKLGAAVIDALLLGVGGRRRELQDFPVLGDVWLRFAEEPVAVDEQGHECEKRHDLLIAPTWEKPTGEVAKLIAGADLPETERRHRNVAYLQDVVVAELTLDELMAVALPATHWWDKIIDSWDEPPHDEIEEEEGYPSNSQLRNWVQWELEAALKGEQTTGCLADGSVHEGYESMEFEDRQAAKLGLVLGFLRAAAEKPSSEEPPEPPATLCAARDLLGEQ
ncbi:MAG: hypothetical protein M3N07_04165, partial [Pseudomonadota bacterium]|nr:hypothetical protein [Pseudomonadota bacterium]